MTINTYHFCTVRDLGAGEMQFQGGCAKVDFDVTTEDGYRRLRLEIGKSLAPPVQDGDEFVICSLSLLSVSRAGEDK